MANGRSCHRPSASSDRKPLIYELDLDNLGAGVAGSRMRVHPKGMTLGELRDFLWADTDEQQVALLQAVFARLSLPIPDVGVIPSRVPVMTMHGAKGLSAKVVFIPGLEEEILPGHWRQPYPGLVLEAARLLYVSITRVRASCIISYGQTRVVNGQFSRRTASRFAVNLSGPFSQRTGGLGAAEVQQISDEVAQL